MRGLVKMWPIIEPAVDILTNALGSRALISLESPLRLSGEDHEHFSENRGRGSEWCPHSLCLIFRTRSAHDLLKQANYIYRNYLQRFLGPSLHSLVL